MSREGPIIDLGIIDEAGYPLAIYQDNTRRPYPRFNRSIAGSLLKPPVLPSVWTAKMPNDTGPFASDLPGVRPLWTSNRVASSNPFSVTEQDCASRIDGHFDLLGIGRRNFAPGKKRFTSLEAIPG
jgi:hypothetical protein